MITNDVEIVSLKHRIMEEVCRLAWNDDLTDESLEKIPYEISPGPKPEWRCCVYKEREVVRHRIRLSLAKNLIESGDTKNVVQVIKPACDQCPISAYSVTDNCRFCMGKACLESCKFGAMRLGTIKMHIEATKCKECGMCAKSCPYGAIVHLERPCKKACPTGAITYDEYGFCQIDDNKCVHCGHCIHSCPFGAIGSKTYLVDIIKDIKAGKKVYALAAPSIEGQFGEDITLTSIRAALKKIGFEDLAEVGLGADMTAAYESQEWSQALKEGRKMTTSCCYAFIEMLKKHFPDQYRENLSQTISPMWAASRYIKTLHPGCVTVFIGPCIAKKAEANDTRAKGNADYAITYGEFRSLLASKDIELEPADENDFQQASKYGKRFASSGGVANAVIECMKERGEDTSDITLMKCAGGKECRQALLLLKAGKLNEDFIEGMVCPGGCVGGPSKHRTELEITKARKKIIDAADDRKILDNLRDLPMDSFSMFRNDD
jgi:[FeFe] hydrogenase (group B1/B3)